MHTISRSVEYAHPNEEKGYLADKSAIGAAGDIYRGNDFVGQAIRLVESLQNISPGTGNSLFSAEPARWCLSGVGIAVTRESDGFKKKLPYQR